MSDKLNELADFLGDQMSKLEALKVKEPTLVEIQKDVDEFFEGKQCSERQVRVYTEGLMAAKIVELEMERDAWKEKATKLQ
jgi:hypothetical protein